MTEDFVQKYGRWAVIAGASEGIGASLADQLAARGLDLVLIARNGPLLEEVAARAREEPRGRGARRRPRPDRSRRGCKVAEATDGLEVGLLIYNAGAANRTTTFLDDSSSSTRSSRSSWTASARSRWPSISAPRCASAAAAASCWSHRWPAWPVGDPRRVFGGEGVPTQLRRRAVGRAAPARRRRVLHPAGHDLHGGVSAHGISNTTRPRTCCPRTWRARSSKTSATAPFTLWERTIGRWHRWSGPSIGAHSSSS